jgi:hypothetical protein
MFGVRGSEFGVRVRGSGFGVRSSEFGVQSSEFGKERRTPTAEPFYCVTSAVVYPNSLEFQLPASLE